MELFLRFAFNGLLYYLSLTLSLIVSFVYCSSLILLSSEQTVFFYYANLNNAEVIFYLITEISNIYIKCVIFPCQNQLTYHEHSFFNILEDSKI